MGRPICVYLDQNIWIALTRGRKEGSGAWHDVATQLAELHEAGKVVLPLSGVHYKELWHKRDSKLREPLGATMRDLSGYATLRPIDAVRHMEIDAYLERWFHGSTRWVSRADVLGHGVNHAFGSPYGRFRFVESLASEGVPEGATTTPPDNWDAVVATGPAWEWFNLVGHDNLLNIGGLDRSPAHRDGSAWMDFEMTHRRNLQLIPAMRKRLWDIIVTEEIQAMTNDLNERCLAAHVEPHGLFFEPPASDPPSAMRSLVEGIPTVHVLAKLRLEKHKDTVLPWEQHDLSDLIALSTAVPYCDAVVTEKRWAHLVTASGLSNRYNTILGAGIAGAHAALALITG